MRFESLDPPAPGAPAPDGADQPIDLGRVSRAVRRHALLVVAGVLVVVVAVLVISERAPKRYEATARIAAVQPADGTTVDPNSIATGLATSRSLVVGPGVLNGAAAQLPGRTGTELSRSVTAAVEPDASILDVTAGDSDPQRAARTADVVASTFLTQRALAQRQAAGRARARLTAQLNAAQGDTAPSGLADAIRARISDLAVAQATAGSDLRLAEQASVPTSPVAPRPMRNAIFAGLSALLLAVVAAVVRDRSGRRRTEARQLANRSELPLLAVVPDGGALGLRAIVRRRGSGANRAIIEHAALQTAVRSALPPRSARTLLVCGINGNDGAMHVARGLARSLSWAGLEAVVVDCASRGPTEAALEAARETEHRYLIVCAPAVDGSSGLPLLAWQADSAILVGRLGRTTPGQVATAAHLLKALDVHVLGLALTAAAADAAAIREHGFDQPATPPSRRVRRPLRNGRSNGDAWVGNGAGPASSERQTAG
jgi:capsular polysaccharide biosynthesis protein